MRESITPIFSRSIYRLMDRMNSGDCRLDSIELGCAESLKFTKMSMLLCMQWSWTKPWSKLNPGADQSQSLKNEYIVLCSAWIFSVVLSILWFCSETSKKHAFIYIRDPNLKNTFEPVCAVQDHLHIFCRISWGLRLEKQLQFLWILRVHFDENSCLC